MSSFGSEFLSEDVLLFRKVSSVEKGDITDGETAPERLILPFVGLSYPTVIPD
jgi:hypothetical protein